MLAELTNRYYTIESPRDPESLLRALAAALPPPPDRRSVPIVRLRTFPDAFGLFVGRLERWDRPIQRTALGHVSARGAGSRISVCIGPSGGRLAVGLGALTLVAGALLGVAQAWLGHPGLGLLIIAFTLGPLVFQLGPRTWRLAREDDRILVGILETAAQVEVGTWRRIPRSEFRTPTLVRRALWGGGI